MRHLIHLAALASGVLLVGADAALDAAVDAALPAELRLAGRWDRRASDRAITVNSGSFVLARFTGTIVTAMVAVFPGDVAWYNRLKTMCGGTR